MGFERAAKRRLRDFQCLKIPQQQTWFRREAKGNSRLAEWDI
jgi:hypothetical protein